jgi:uncharacterized circularly permuted ATP-grasp superfamily protein/uncharacterized alpha-E superfamily protein
MTAAADLLHSFAALPDLARRQFDADRVLTFEGAGHIVHDLPVRADGRTVSLASRPWRLDPIPYVLDGGEFEMLRAGVVARMQMFERIIGDLYGARRLLAERVVDSEALWSSSRYRVAAIGERTPKRWLTSYSVDVMRDVEGVWHVVADRTDAPSGVGYALLDRLVSTRVHRDITTRVRGSDGLQHLDPFIDRLRDGLADLSDVQSPRIVVMSGGVDHPSFVEQSFLATQLGLNLAEGADLIVRRRKLWLRSLAGFEPIDVLFRRLEDDRIDPMEVNTEGGAGVPGLLLATSSGGVRLANTHGSGVIEDPELADDWDAAGHWLDESPSTVGPRTLLRHLSAERRVNTQWELQPTYDGSEVVYRPVVMRMHLAATDQGIEVLPGSNARVLAMSDDPLLPTLARAKDMWVLGASDRVRIGRSRPLPQVDLVASVPTRAAEALFWAGRALERTELVARTLRVVLDRTGGTADTEHAERWVGPAIGMLGHVAGLDVVASSAATVHGTDDFVPTASLASAATALTNQLGSLLAEVSSVREFFSITAGRLFARLADQRRDIGGLVSATIFQPNGAPRPTVDGLDAALAADLEAGLLDSGLLDSVLIDLASLTGLWNDSMMRGPAWRIGEIGRRLERAFGVIDVLRGAVEWFEMTELDDDAQRLIEIVLATNESLVAYRRRYRSDVEFAAAVELVVADASNPRSAAFAIGAVQMEAERLGWSDGEKLAGDLADELQRARLRTPGATTRALDQLYVGCDRLARDLVGRYLASPVDPHTMGGAL